ncbi:MAG: hypothetical protein SGILL_010540 [Bacillariaceae sp.]
MKLTSFLFSSLFATHGLFAAGQSDDKCNSLINEFFIEEGSDGLPLTLRWTVNVDSTDSSKSTLSMQYEVTKQSWVSFGMAKTDGKMEGAEVIIGLPDDGTVLKYTLTNFTPIVMPAEQQTLMDATIVQDEEGTILTYTKFLEEEGEIPIIPGMASTVGASGMDNTLGYHGPSKGGAPFPLFPDCIDGILVTEAPMEANMTEAPSPEPGSGGSSKVSWMAGLCCSVLAVGLVTSL